MVESSKILTVSYGTFSCTLEGFEDSFSTMKAIAEYFRDLAAEDRFFGAEPPVPDAEMLGRIAEREIARRVEARKSDTGVHLRAAPQDDAPAMPPVATPPAAIADDAESFFAASEAPAITDDAVEDIEALVGEVEDTETEAPEADFEAAPMAAAPAHPDPTSVAAKLQRIQAVVGKTEALDDADFTDDVTETALPEVAEQEVDVADATPQDDVVADDAVDTDVTAEEVEDTATPSDSTDTVSDETDAQISQVLRNLERAGATVSDDVDVAPVAEAAADVTAAEVDVAEVLGDADVVLDEQETEAPTAEADSEAAVEIEPEVAEDPAPALAQTPAPAKNGLRARILRVAKKAPPAVAETVTPEPAEPEVGADLDGAEELTAFADAGSDSLSPAEEADLQAELAALSADDDIETDVMPVEETNEVEQAPKVEDATDAVAAALADTVEETPVRPRRASLPDTNDAEMTRIMEQADEELSNPEGSRRRAAIAQLKAAVAATEAARQLGDDSKAAAKTEDAFREDLDQVVRPRRAQRPEPTEERAERPRPGPLKLVASQRVDATEATASTDEQTVRARRVSKGAGDAQGATSFSDFAAEMGATELPDLLEAAAAYTAYVEGEAEFSRPQIMRKVQASSDSAFSREDGLRSFGTLLRQGRINKAGNGRFQVSDQTRFKPEQKAG